MPHPLRRRPTVYNGHLRGPVTLTPVAERLAVELALPVFDLGLSRPRIKPRSPACEANAPPLRSVICMQLRFCVHGATLGREVYASIQTMCTTSALAI